MRPVDRTVGLLSVEAAGDDDDGDRHERRSGERQDLERGQRHHREDRDDGDPGFVAAERLLGDFRQINQLAAIEQTLKPVGGPSNSTVSPNARRTSSKLACRFSFRR